VGELRQVLRPGEHRGVDLALRRRVQPRGELARRQRAAAPGEVVARGAVEPEQLAAAGRVVAAQGVAGGRGYDRAAAVGLDVRAERLEVGRAFLGGRVVRRQ